MTFTEARYLYLKPFLVLVHFAPSKLLVCVLYCTVDFAARQDRLWKDYSNE